MIKNYKDLKVWQKSYESYGSVCELETQIWLAGDLSLIGKGELDKPNKAIAEIERMLKALIISWKQTLESLTPWPLFSNEIGEEP